jgi:hypothetical protein
MTVIITYTSENRIIHWVIRSLFFYVCRLAVFKTNNLKTDKDYHAI